MEQMDDDEHNPLGLKMQTTSFEVKKNMNKFINKPRVAPIGASRKMERDESLSKVKRDNSLSKM